MSAGCRVTHYKVTQGLAIYKGTTSNFTHFYFARIYQAVHFGFADASFEKGIIERVVETVHRWNSVLKPGWPAGIPIYAENF